MNTTAIEKVEHVEPVVLDSEAVALGTLRANSPAGVITQATEIATGLAALIKDRNLSSNISGKEYVRCEGWTTLAAILGVTPHEVEVVEDDGIYTATVELRRLSDGSAVARASAECGAPDEQDKKGEPIWANRPRYARRSMALTRATAKACRLAFSWIMVLGGYEATPAEEITGGTGLPDAIPFGKDKGKKLTDCSDDHLVKIKAWCEEKQKFGDLVEAIDLELEERRVGE